MTVPLRRLGLLAMILLAWPFSSTAGALAITFDDGLDPRVQPQAAEWNAAILSALKAARVHSILFAAGSRVDSEAGLALVRDWGRAGHAIGNHTYSHRNFGSDPVTLPDFEADILRDESLLQDIPGWTRRFRFPFLQEGDTASKRDDITSWLAHHGYRTGAVSIDASNWYYNNRYLAWMAAHPGADPSGFRSAYLDHLCGRAAYYDGLSEQLLHRSVAHVLLLHTNAINAAFLPDVIARFRSGGRRVVSPDRAFRDPVYQSLPDVLPAGQSILWSLAKQQGIGGLRYPAEDDVYEKPILDARGL